MAGARLGGGQHQVSDLGRMEDGQGLGHQMIEWAVAQCQARGCGMVQLTSNKSRTEAHRFYARLGFEASHEGFKRLL